VNFELTDRQLLLVRFALLNFSRQARAKAEEAAQDKDATVYVNPPAAIRSFMRDAEDAEELRELFQRTHPQVSGTNPKE
jgi:hypothetical protein